MSAPAMASEAAPKSALEGGSISALLRERVPLHGSSTGYKVKEDGEWKEIAWDEFYGEVKALGATLLAKGYKKGDRLVILANTCYEWTLLDFACLSVGVCVVPIYPTSVKGTIQYILNDCGAKGLVYELDEHLENVEAVKAECAELQDVWHLFDDVWAFVEEGADKTDTWEAAADNVSGDEMATIVYTSGTTGDPKGVVLRHSNLTMTTAAGMECVDQEPGWTTFLFLPLAHIYARIVQFGSLYMGSTIAYVEKLEPAIIMQNINEVKPEVLPSVPRIFEKVYAKATAKFEQATGVRASLLAWAQEVGTRVSDLRQQGKEPVGLLAVKYRLADRLVFSKIKGILGGNIRLCISGGAPLPLEVALFFHRFGIQILEGYGLTETTASSFVNRRDNYKFGTVGLPTPGMEVKIAEDGEILLRGPGVFTGYYNKAEATAKALDHNGWFATGDIGELDSDGFLRITDRKKNLIVTAGGKNVAPAYVENKMKTLPFISQILVHGDNRKHLSALITINVEELLEAATDIGVAANASPEELIAHDNVRQIFTDHVDRVNELLESYQQVKKFELLAEDFSVENGQLTPTFKVKRKAVEAKYQDILDSFYA